MPRLSRGAEVMKASELRERIMRCADAFAAGAPRHDNTTLVVTHRPRRLGGVR